MKTAFEIEWQAPPANIVANVAAKGRRLTTLFNQNDRDAMVWHRWDGPAGQPHLILLHGGWGSWTHWIKCIPALAAHTTVLAADIPGMGDSDEIGHPDTIDPVAPLIASGISDLLENDERYDIAGFSFGGVAAAHVAALHGERCRSFTAVGAAGFGPLHNAVAGIKLPDPRLEDDEINAIHARNLNILMLARESSIDPLAVHIHRTNIERGRLRSRRISMSSTLVDILPNIEARIGGIWGALDITGNGEATIEKRREILRACQPGCPFDIIENAGHWIMYEAPDAFLDAFIRHLDHHAAA